VGASASFDGTTMSMIPHVEAYQSSKGAMTVSFWVYLRSDSLGSMRSLLKKGHDITERTPTIMLWDGSRRLHVRVSTEVHGNEGFDSVAIVPLRRWTHICVVMQGKLLQLFVNGIFDSQAVLKGNILFNTGPFFLGKDPWHVGTRSYMDDVRVYDDALNDEEVQALVSASAGFTQSPQGPSFVRLGCDSKPCTLHDALSSCPQPQSYHLCSVRELYSGAMAQARANGWFHLTERVWPRNQSPSGVPADEKRLAICCRND
jgi:hypothetical protein